MLLYTLLGISFPRNKENIILQILFSKSFFHNNSSSILVDLNALMNLGALI